MGQSRGRAQDRNAAVSAKGIPAELRGDFKPLAARSRIGTSAAHRTGKTDQRAIEQKVTDDNVSGTAIIWEATCLCWVWEGQATDVANAEVRGMRRPMER